MSADKMLVVTLAKTKAVLAAATRQAAGPAQVADLASGGLLMRVKGGDATIAVPPGELDVKEVERSDDVFRNPQTYVVGDDGTAVSVTPPGLTAPTAGSEVFNITLNSAPSGGKAAMLIVDLGANQEPLKFFSQTVDGVTTVPVTVSGVTTGKHFVLASVDGYASALTEQTF